MKWVRVIAKCSDCSVVIDLPALIEKGTHATARLIHAEAKHYVDLDTEGAKP